MKVLMSVGEVKDVCRDRSNWKADVSCLLRWENGRVIYVCIFYRSLYWFFPANIPVTSVAMLKFFYSCVLRSLSLSFEIVA